MIAPITPPTVTGAIFLRVENILVKASIFFGTSLVSIPLIAVIACVTDPIKFVRELTTLTPSACAFSPFSPLNVRITVPIGPVNPARVVEKSCIELDILPDGLNIKANLLNSSFAVSANPLRLFLALSIFVERLLTNCEVVDIILLNPSLFVKVARSAPSNSLTDSVVFLIFAAILSDAPVRLFVAINTANLSDASTIVLFIVLNVSGKFDIASVTALLTTANLSGNPLKNPSTSPNNSFNCDRALPIPVVIAVGRFLKKFIPSCCRNCIFCSNVAFQKSFIVSNCIL